MASPKGKKITLGSVVGIIVAILLVVAQQKGWLPTSGADAGREANTSTQNDRQTDSTQAGTSTGSDAGPAGREHTGTGRTLPGSDQPAPGRTSHNTSGGTGRTGEQAVPGGDGGIGELFRAERSDVIVTASGLVQKVLPDDIEGSRHQRLILRLSTGHTVLIAHNIDLAPRVPCDEGDLVRFRGEYEWTQQGGVVHWTHHDPAGRHQPGWIEHDGERYE